MLVWLGDRSQAAASFAAAFLHSYNGNGTATDGNAKATDVAGGPKAYTSSGLSTIYAGHAAAAFIGLAQRDARVPDLIGIAQHGVVFTGGTKKIAEHGGNDPQDRHVPLVVAGPSVWAGLDTKPVETAARSYDPAPAQPQPGVAAGRCAAAHPGAPPAVAGTATLANSRAVGLFNSACLTPMTGGPRHVLFSCGH